MKAGWGRPFEEPIRSESANGALTHREKSAILAVWLLSMRLQMPSGAKLTARID
ncbi:hypothetical protein [Bradyrhizobium sp. CCBAU 11361]|uniref:hypothetical protein n=1 Tax=Bradyrhizobium sp. CCBAU 11361 TaxID=1630812 RepID=UPI00230314CE|nr:hypothetical protein [Bradyrhizobium sp. CCBAU 11361]